MPRQVPPGRACHWSELRPQSNCQEPVSLHTWRDVLRRDHGGETSFLDFFHWEAWREGSLAAQWAEQVCEHLWHQDAQQPPTAQVLDLTHRLVSHQELPTPSQATPAREFQTSLANTTSFNSPTVDWLIHPGTAAVSLQEPTSALRPGKQRRAL